MATTTFEQLKTAIADWLARSDLTTYIPDFITLAEGHLNRNVRHRSMITTTTLTPSSYVCTLPTDYLNYVRVVESTSPRRELIYATPQAIDQLYPSRSAGPANHFTIIGSALQAFPLTSNNIELTYRQKIPALSDSNTTNWLLTTTPELYLRTAQVEALNFINEVDTPRYQSTVLLSQKLIDDLNNEGTVAEYYKAAVSLRGQTP